jgi:hypothetical protein
MAESPSPSTARVKPFFAQGDPVDSVFYILSTRVITESFKALAVAETTEILTRPSRNAPWSSGKTTTLADEISGLERSFVSDS